MSSWPYGTTADIGICVFASSPESLICQAVEGMQGILLSSEGIEYNYPSVILLNINFCIFVSNKTFIIRITITV
mgnify:CR=1 FL=1